MPAQTIPVKVSLERISGTIMVFAAFVNHTLLFAGDGPMQQGETEVPEGPITLKIRAWGVGRPTYAFKLDLPGTIRDANLTFTLEGGYHEFSLVL